MGKKINKKNTDVQAVSETEEVLASDVVENVETKTVVAEETSVDTTDDMPTEDIEKVEDVGEASFEQKSNNKLVFVGAFVAVLIVGGALFARATGFLVPNMTYTNSASVYSYSYPQGLELVAEGSIPAELASQGVTEMAQLNLTNGDSLLIKNTGDKEKGEVGDNIVYTVLELSSRANFVDYESYTTALFANLDQTKETKGIDYTKQDSVVGKGIPSVEYSFEMEVPIDQAGNTRTGVFYDNVFQTPDGRAYSISFGYPKDVADPEVYLKTYRKILASFRPGDVPFVKPETEAIIPESVLQVDVTNEGVETAE